MAIWSRKFRQADEQELQDYEEWMMQVSDPEPTTTGIRRLEAEIRAKRNDILNALAQRYVRPRTVKIAAVRNEVCVLQGMVFAYLYLTGKWDIIQPITIVTEDVNDLAMLWLSVDLKKMRQQAFGSGKEP